MKRREFQALVTKYDDEFNLFFFYQMMNSILLVEIDATWFCMYRETIANCVQFSLTSWKTRPWMEKFNKILSSLEDKLWHLLSS